MPVFEMAVHRFDDDASPTIGRYRVWVIEPSLHRRTRISWGLGVSISVWPVG
jgi:hypothetical protein